MGDVDISLRSIASAMPEDLSGALFPGAKVEVKGWRESQLTRMERRVDDLLELVVDGEPLLQHVEWQLEWEGDLLERAYAYQSMTVLAQLQEIAARRAEATARRAAGETVPGASREAIVPVESVVVLLSGRQGSWEPELKYRTSRVCFPDRVVSLTTRKTCSTPGHRTCSLSAVVAGQGADFQTAVSLVDLPCFAALTRALGLGPGGHFWSKSGPRRRPRIPEKCRGEASVDSV